MIFPLILVSTLLLLASPDVHVVSCIFSLTSLLFIASPSFDNIVSQKFRHLAVAYITLLLTYLLLLSPCHAVGVPDFAGLTAVAVALGNFFSLWILICQFF
jgi:hypothetical protein